MWHKGLPPVLVAASGDKISVAELVNKFSCVGEVSESILIPAS
jgi:hypothetical protein